MARHSPEAAAPTVEAAPRSRQQARLGEVVAAASRPVPKAPRQWEVRAPMQPAAVRVPRQARSEAAAEQRRARR